eukprot:CAMPEP_0170457422 /NCGR_PEP_ID=MMETSP0123-20130129/4715_1 /TAXON_ID=182087 /ORGANISM="Favella ehrenbergii, Strain Fehren 1" /LENGTH=254 /DNA_ID=CAMNT_0010721201 /DNA_START=3055 /DNA_END=3819 /DNA_ORIENTATION=+
MANLIVFILAASAPGASAGRSDPTPKYFYKVIAWTGVYATLDPWFVLLLDCITQHWTGDYFQFYIWFEKQGDSGIVGIYLTFFMIITCTIVTGYFFYRFMVGVYMNGRILDLYRRLSGNYKTFFIPMDHEVSLKYLQWIIMRAKKQNCVVMSEKRNIKDKFGMYQDIYLIQIFKIQKNMLKMNRLFFKDFDGSIIEVPQKKIFVKTKELKHVKKMGLHGGASVYNKPDAEFVPLNQLCRNTNYYIRNNREIGTL